MGYQAVRDEAMEIIHYIELGGMDELYDLKADPYENEQPCCAFAGRRNSGTDAGEVAAAHRFWSK